MPKKNIFFCLLVAMVGIGCIYYTTTIISRNKNKSLARAMPDGTDSII